MKNKIFLILLLLFFLLIIDYNLSFYGKGYNIFNTKITYGFNTDFDSLEGFKIEEDGFLKVIGNGTKINNDLIVENITKYGYNSKGIFCNIIDKKGKINYVKVTYDKNRPLGNKINYNLITNYKIDNNLIWYDVVDSLNIKYLVITNFVLKLLLLFNVVLLFKKKK